MAPLGGSQRESRGRRGLRRLGRGGTPAPPGCRAAGGYRPRTASGSGADYYGRFLRRSGRAVLARAPLARALEECEACGATRLAWQARGELEASGGRRRRVSSVWLSPRELRVAQLAAQGATNAEIASPLFISAKTVEHHLTSVYAKLGVRSRRELRGHFQLADEKRRQDQQPGAAPPVAGATELSWARTTEDPQPLA